jgi:hypothetical protein
VWVSVAPRLQGDFFVYEVGPRSPRSKASCERSAVMANMARAVLVASLTLSADAFLAPLPAAATLRLQRPALSPLRGARVRTGLSTLQAASAAPLGRGPQVTQPECPRRLVPPVGRCISTWQPRSLLLHQSCQGLIKRRSY